jgi:hypothetical protein
MSLQSTNITATLSKERPLLLFTHTILFEVGGTIYDTHTLQLFKELGIVLKE